MPQSSRLHQPAPSQCVLFSTVRSIRIGQHGGLGRRATGGRRRRRAGGGPAAAARRPQASGRPLHIQKMALFETGPVHSPRRSGLSLDQLEQRMIDFMRLRTASDKSKDAFRFFDRNASGQIDRASIRQAFELAQLHVTAAQIDELFSRYDVNKMNLI
jgi:hypothetical protein